MINVAVRVGGGLVGITGMKYEILELKEGTDLQTLTEILCSRIGDDILQPTTVVVVNGTKLNEPEKRNRILKDGDVVSFFRALVGG